MAIKAKLDILDIVTDENVKRNPDEESILEQDEGSESPQTIGLHFSKVQRWIHRPFFWIILLSGLLFSFIAGFFFIKYRGNDAGRTIAHENQVLSGSNVQDEGKNILYEGFVIDQKDEKGNIRIIFCDIALGMEKPGKIGHDPIDVRNVIYAALKKVTVKEGLSLEGRNHFKKELRGELNKLFTDNSVESVYVTRFEMY